MHTFMYFYRNIGENKDGKKNEGSYLSCVTNGEFYFINDMIPENLGMSARKK